MLSDQTANTQQDHTTEPTRQTTNHQQTTETTSQTASHQQTTEPTNQTTDLSPSEHYKQWLTEWFMHA